MKTNFLKKSLTALLSLSMAFSAMTLPTFAANVEEKLTIATVTANSEYAGNGINLVKDGNAGTFWETNWAAANHSPSETNPIVVTAMLTETEKVSTIKITPRQGSNISGGDANGRFIKARYTYLDDGGNAIGEPFTLTHGTAGSAPSEADIVIEVNAEIAGLKIEVLSAFAAGNDVTATMAELAFYKEGAPIVIDTTALEAKIEEAIATDISGMSAASIAALYNQIGIAKNVVKNATSNEEVAAAIMDLEEAMKLEVSVEKDVINLTGTKDLPRESNFNEGWLFRETTDESSNVVLDESQFTSVNLPHDFSIDNDYTTQGEAESGYLLGGTGWYRKHFVLPASAAGKQITLNFDGSYMDTYVYVNGEFVGEHHNGYSQFTMDLTDYVVADGKTDNVIAVKVVNTIPSSRWYSGSGIYRDVTLFVKESTHIKQDGLFVHTENVSASKATVVVENEIENATGSVKTTIYDKDGKEVATNTVNAAAATKQSFDITNPDLWSVDTYTPALYTVKSEIIVNGVAVDTVVDKFGIKSIRFDRNTGFYLNGEAMKLKGVCQHHDQGALGAAANYHAIYRQVKILKDMGCNSIRVTHNPASEALLDACDELGMVVINEMFDGLYRAKNGNSYDFARWFNQTVSTNQDLMGVASNMTWAEFSARQTVRMSRNHASIILYSVGNEVQEGASGDCSGYPAKIREICTWMKDEDPYTLPTVGSNWLKSGNGTAVSYCTVIAEEFGGPIGFNYANTSQMESLRNAHPTWVVYGSETSSAHHSRDVYYTQGSDQVNKVTTDYENESSRAGWGHSASTAWKIANETTWNMGEYVWTGFDYLGEPTPWNNTNKGGSFPAARSSTFGIIDTNGLWKDITYLYHSFWNEDERTLHVTDSWTANMGSTVLMQVFSDADKVELYVNGKLFGSDTSTVQSNGNRYFSNSKFHAEFNVPFAAGTVEVKAYDLVNGNYVEVKDTVGVKKVTTPGAATTTTLKSDRDTLACDGYELAYVEINVVDKDGNICTEFNNNVNISVEGEGKIVGVDSGKQSEMQSYRIDDPKRHTKAVFNGKSIAIVQSTKRAGEIKVSVSGSGLAKQTITLNSVPVSDSTEITSVEYSSKYAIFEGENLALPKTVEAVQENGATVEKDVTWDTSAVNTKKAGIYTAIGTMEGTNVTFNAAVTVYAPVAAAENYSALYHEGGHLELPTETVVYYKDGTKAGTYPIQWKYYDVNEFKSGDKVTINGTVSIASKTMPIVAEIRVLDPLPAKANFAQQEGDMPVISQSCTRTADNINSLNNGIINSTDANQRWTDWNQQGDQVVWVQYEWKNKYTFGEMVAYMWMDGNGCQDPKNIDYTIQMKNDAGEWVNVPITYITAVAYYDGDGKTTFDMLEPVTTNGLRLTMDKRQANIFTGMTELEANEYVATVPAETNADMTSIKVNGQKIDTTAGTEFEVEGKADVLSVAVEDVKVAETATYVVLRDDTTGIVRVIVRAEDGTNKTYAFTFTDAEAEPKLPAKVENVKAKDTNYKTITLTWNAAENATAYEVYRKAYDSEEFKLYKTVEDTTLAVSGVMTGKEYAFYVIAKNEAGAAEASATVVKATTLHGEVTLAIEKVSTSTFKLSWNAIDGATRYIVYRKRNDDKMKKVLTLGAKDLTYTTAELPHGEYQFILKAGRYDSKDRVMTDASNTVIGSVETLRPTVTLKAATKAVKVTWNKMEGVTHYQVYRATSEDGKYTKLITTTETSYTAKSLSSGKKYFFKVRGYKTYKSGTDIKYTVYTPYSAIKYVTVK
ncbi:MAG: glycoside hydrolase family 2 TIM barrel-domain containing protein [Longicatena sp.]|nr:glycoside hydrolase family 2 TIM barrel-domain containing protein [Longicatena sp.]